MTIEAPLLTKYENLANGAEVGLPLAVLHLDRSGRAWFANPAWTTMTGLSRERTVGHGWLGAVDPRDAGSLLGQLTDGVVDSLRHTDCRVGLHEQTRWTRWWFSRTAESTAVCVADIADDKAMVAQLLHRATHDGLTGLANRSYFLECVAQALRSSVRSRRHIAIAYLDLDGFKAVNDLRGHAHGDRVLREVGTRIRTTTRAEDVTGRVGGDEFAILSSSPIWGDIDVLVERVLRAISWPTCGVHDGALQDGAIHATAGLARALHPYEDAEALLARADQAMYCARSTSRGRNEDQRARMAGSEILHGAGRP